MRGKSIRAIATGCGTGAASMRPAHYAREVLLGRQLKGQLHCCFNEARALCAGSPPVLPPPSAAPVASMRPAHYAREVEKRRGAEAPLPAASMRPAHYAREVRGVR